MDEVDMIAYKLSDIHQAASGEFVSSADFYESAVDIIDTLTDAGWRPPERRLCLMCGKDADPRVIAYRGTLPDCPEAICDGENMGKLCMFDMTQDEALNHWRRTAHEQLSAGWRKIEPGKATDEVRLALLRTALSQIVEHGEQALALFKITINGNLATAVATAKAALMTDDAMIAEAPKPAAGGSAAGQGE